MRLSFYIYIHSLASSGDNHINTQVIPPRSEPRRHFAGTAGARIPDSRHPSSYHCGTCGQARKKPSSGIWTLNRDLDLGKQVRPKSGSASLKMVMSLAHRTLPQALSRPRTRPIWALSSLCAAIWQGARLFSWICLLLTYTILDLG